MTLLWVGGCTFLSSSSIFPFCLRPLCYLQSTPTIHPVTNHSKFLSVTFINISIIYKTHIMQDMKEQVYLSCQEIHFFLQICRITFQSDSCLDCFAFISILITITWYGGILVLSFHRLVVEK